MGFHVTNFGAFSNNLSRFADINGFVPVAGDVYDDDFCYEEPNDFDDPDTWGEFVQEAVEATKTVNQKVDEWREENA